MNHSIIDLSQYLPNDPQEFDYAQYNQRAAGRYLRQALCHWITTLVDCTVTVAIGLCITISTLIFLTIL